MLGSASNAAPPLSVKASSSTSDRGVGAHQQHLKSSTWHAPIKCTDCHLVPKATTDPGHIDTPLPAELTFSALAKTDGAKPAWSGTTCSGTYCHGSTLSGGSITAPVWTKVDGSQSTCSSCHGMPPAAGHPASTSCAACHTGVVDANNKIIAPTLHIDGKITASGGHPAGYGSGSVHGPDFLNGPQSCTACHGPTLTGGSAKSCDTCHSGWKTNCTFCHGGTSNTTGAPPVSVAKATSATVPAVGQHTSHLTTGATHNAYSCGLCHKVPVDALSAGHIDPSPGEVLFTGLASGASYSHTTHQCTSVYCHGNGKSGATGSALWTGTLSGCSSCHDDETDGQNMTLSGRHEKHIVDKKLKCNACHNCVVNGAKQIIDKGKHVDGKRDVCVPSWNPTNKTCSPPGCHGLETW